MHRPPFLLLVLSSLATVVEAGQWQFTPSVSLREIYSDNIGLSETDPQDDWVTELTPALNLRGQSDRFQMSLNASAQLLYYQDASINDGDHTETNPALAFNSTTTVLPSLLFLDLGGTAGQRLTSSNNRGSYDNIALSGDRSDYYTYNVAPYLRHRSRNGHFLELRAEHSVSEFEEGEPNTGDVLNDTETESYRLRADNQSAASRLHWSLSGNKRYVDRVASGQSDSRFQDGQLDLSFELAKTIDLLARAGTTENELSGYDSEFNGDYSAAGMRWSPNRRFHLSAMSGTNYEDAEMAWKPSQRSEFNLGYRNSTVGLVRGPSWRANMALHGRHFGSTLSYTEEVTTEQQLLQDGAQLVPLLDDAGNPVVDPITNLPLFTLQPNYAIADDEFQRDRAALTLSWKARRGNLSLSLAAEERHYLNRTELDSDGEDIVLALNMPLSGSYSLISQYRDSHTVYRNDGDVEDFRLLSISLRTNLSPRSYASLGVQRAEQISDRTIQSYEEGRIIAELVMRF